MKQAAFGEWKHHPETKRLHNYLKRISGELMEAWANGQYTTESTEGTAQLNAKAIGKYEAISEILGMEYDYDE